MKNSQKKDAKLQKFPWKIEQLHKKKPGNSKIPIEKHEKLTYTRPDTQLPQSRAGGQGQCSRSLEHLGKSCETKNRINAD